MEDGCSRAPARRSIAAALIALLVFLTQIGPALACDEFDGPGGPGCPALFHDPATPFGDDDRQAPDDCSNGPSYLALEVLPLQLHAPASGGDDALAGGWAAVVAADFRAPLKHLVEINAIPPPIHRGHARQRYAYLHTLRLRI